MPAFSLFVVHCHSLLDVSADIHSVHLGVADSPDRDCIANRHAHPYGNACSNPHDDPRT